MRLQQRLMEGHEIVSRDGFEVCTPTQGEMAVGMLAVHRG